MFVLIFFFISILTFVFFIYKLTGILQFVIIIMGEGRNYLDQNYYFFYW